MYTQAQLSQLERHAIPPQAWQDWAWDKLVNKFAHRADGGIAIGYHPEAGWFALFKQDGHDKQERRLLYVQKEIDLPDEQADFSGIIDHRFANYGPPETSPPPKHAVA